MVLSEQEFSELEKRKVGLFDQSKALGAAIRAKYDEKKGIKLPERAESAAEVKEKITDLEFRLSTESTSLAQEREIVKQVRAAQKELQAALQGEKEREKLRTIAREIDKLKDETNALEAEIQKVKAEISAAYEAKRAAWTARTEARKASEERKRAEDFARLKDRVRRERGESRKKELAPFMKRHTELSLEDIVVIKKKTQA